MFFFFSFFQNKFVLIIIKKCIIHVPATDKSIMNRGILVVPYWLRYWRERTFQSSKLPVPTVLISTRFCSTTEANERNKLIRQFIVDRFTTVSYSATHFYPLPFPLSFQPLSPHFPLLPSSLFHSLLIQPISSHRSPRHHKREKLVTEIALV